MWNTILQWATFIAVAGYTVITWIILNKTNNQNSLATVLLLFQDVKNDYKEVEFIIDDGVKYKIKHGYNGFVEAFHLREHEYDLSVALRAMKPLNYLASFKLIAINYSILIDKLNTLNEKDKQMLTSFIYSFYDERLKPFVNLILIARDKNTEDKDIQKNTNIYKVLADKIYKLKPGV